MIPRDFADVECEVSAREGSYKGLSAQALLTSREDFEAIFSSLPHIERWVEPGSGHGLGPCLFAELHPSKSATGIEFEEARFKNSQKLKETSGLSNVEFIHADLMESDVPDGDAYFLYFPTGIVLDKILHRIGTSPGSPLIIVIESHGDLIPRLQKEPWLEEVKKIPLHSCRHSPNAVVFKKTGQVSDSLHWLSFVRKHLLLKEDNGEKWLGESYGLEWSRNNEFNLLTPPRTIRSSQVEAVYSPEEVEPRYRPALHLRQLGPIRIESNGSSYSGHLRKIFVSPCFKVEISSGQQLEWSQIKKIFWENTLCYDSLSGYCFFPRAV